jgi:predicted O-methyltransferase YrrM
MNLSKFKTNLMRLLCSTEGEEPFHALRMMTGGLSSPKIAKIINYACKCCDYGKEAYVEIGTYSGYTLAAAAYQNNTTCVGIDDLSMDDFFANDEWREQGRKDCREMIKKAMGLVKNKNVMFVEEDFRKIDKLEFKPDPRKIGVLYIDGFHSYEQTTQAFTWAEPQFADEAIVICDDVNLPQVYRAVVEQALTGKYVIDILAKHTTDDFDVTLDQYISTGLAVLHYVRPK